MSENKVANLAITVDDGLVEVPVKNKHGDQIGVFYFRPTDVGIIDRFNSMVADFDKIVEPVENININPDGTADEEDAATVSALKQAEERLYEAFNKLFGGNFAEAFFAKMHPFSPVGGKFYAENALEAVGAFLSAQFDAEIKKVNARVTKYTHGYEARTGKHKDGRK